MVGYSSTPLAKKLGIRPGFKMLLINAPDYYFKLFTDLPSDVQLLNDKKSKKNFIHLFTKDIKTFEAHIHDLKNEIEPNGIIWVSWYKRSAKIPTDLTEDIIRNTALSIGLIDVKVCAVDNVWSGLKLVIPLKNRTH
jgi:ABC-type lipoprotein release transport system permease subunit